MISTLDKWDKSDIISFYHMCDKRIILMIILTYNEECKFDRFIKV
jgi:hypothetical protein